jgi:pyrimidine deaminase RibD-like protein
MPRIDYSLIELALKTAEKCKPEGPANPKVGAVVRLSNGEVHAAFRGEPVRSYRGQQKMGDHAEFTLLHKKLRSKARLIGATLYTTLEPCTERNHDKLPCVEWIIQKGIKHVVIGLLDPNPRICGKGYWRLVESEVDVDFFPSVFRNRLLESNRKFIDVYREPAEVDEAFGKVLRSHQSDRVAPYKMFGVGQIIELLASPDRREGWPLEEVILRRQVQNPFILPQRFKAPYRSYIRDYGETKGFANDGVKFMLERNPIAWEEAPTLQLGIRPTKYSTQHFYRDFVSSQPGQSATLIETLLHGSLTADFPHACSLQMVVVTRDQKILLAERSAKTGTYQKLWSVSAEEDLHPKDFRNGVRGAALAWGRRLLLEEMALDDTAYLVDHLRLLSIFLETEPLNISFCGYVELKYTAEQLDMRLSERRGDIEFNRWTFLEIDRGKLLDCIFGQAERRYHPSSRYRLLLTFLKCFGRPTSEDLRRYAPEA